MCEQMTASLRWLQAELVNGELAFEEHVAGINVDASALGQDFKVSIRPSLFGDSNQIISNTINYAPSESGLIYILFDRQGVFRVGRQPPQ